MSFDQEFIKYYYSENRDDIINQMISENAIDEYEVLDAISALLDISPGYAIQEMYVELRKLYGNECDDHFEQDIEKIFIYLIILYEKLTNTKFSMNILLEYNKSLKILLNI